MHPFPSYPAVDDAPPALLERGHLWLHEWVDGAPFRFQALSDGRLRFGDEVRTFTEVPPAYEHAARYVREAFDRDALRRAVDDVESVVFYGYAMHRRGVDYDWAATPNVVGSDVWSATREEYLLPDRVAKIYDGLGLGSLPTVQAEVRAADFDPDAYAIPDSAYYDGPAAGVLLRNKTGLRARLDNPAVGDDGSEPVADAETFTDRYVTESLFETLAARLESEGRAVTFDSLYDRVVEHLTRAHHRQLFAGDVDVRAVRSAVADRTGTFLADRQ